VPGGVRNRIGRNDQFARIGYLDLNRSGQRSDLMALPTPIGGKIAELGTPKTEKHDSMSSIAIEPHAETLLLLRLQPGAMDALRQHFSKTRAEGAQLATLLPESALPKLAHAAGVSPELPDAIVTLPTGTRDLTAAIAPMIRYADASRSRILAVRRYPILPGRDSIRLVFALRRLERLSAAEFYDYWLNRHADYGRRLIPPYTYHQLHADPVATQRGAAAAGLLASDYDGVVEVHFPDLEAFTAQLSRPEVAEGALADERNFIDHARSVFWAYREER
jgi:hypothetical protein